MKIAIVDIETSGFDQYKDHILELGIAILDIDNGKIKKAFDNTIYENGYHSNGNGPDSWIYHNSSLTYDEVINSQNLEDYRDEIQHILSNECDGLTAFNSSFDFKFLKHRGFQFQEQSCIMRACTPILDLPPAPGMNTPKFPKAQEAWDYFFPGTGYIEEHRGYADAEMEAKILYEVIKMEKYPFK